MFKFIANTLLISTLPSIVYASSDINNSESIFKMIMKMLFYIIMFIIVLFFAFYGTKFFAKRSKNLMKSKYIEVIDSVSVGSNFKLLIAKILDKYYILAIDNNNVTLIDRIDDKNQIEDYMLDKQKNFDDYLTKHKNKQKLNHSDLFFKVKEKIFKQNDKEDENHEKHI